MIKIYLILFLFACLSFGMENKRKRPWEGSEPRFEQGESSKQRIEDQQSIQENKNIKEQLTDLIISFNNYKIQTLAIRNKIKDCLIKMTEIRSIKFDEPTERAEIFKKMDETNKLEELNKQLIEVMRDQINNITKEKEITEQILDINKSLNPNNFSLNKNKHVNLQENSKNKG